MADELDEPTVVEAPAADVGPVLRLQERRPVLVGWLRSREAFGATVRWAAGWAAHWAAFHAVRLPLYAVRLVVRSPLGLGHVVVVSYRWVVDASGADARHAALAASASADAWRRAVHYHREHTAMRAGVVAVPVVGVVLALVWVAGHGSRLALAGSVALVLVVLGAAAPRAREVVSSAAESAQVPPLTADLVRSALGSLGVAGIDKAVRDDPRELRILMLGRDGAGWRCDVDLPPGATAEQVVDRRSRLASGLRRPLGCVWPSGDPEVHEGRLVLYVADRTLSEAGLLAWPLEKSGKANVFEPFVLGQDPRGKPVSMTLMYASGLIGAVPGMGKTFMLRLILLAASLDVRTEIHAHNLKGGADLDQLAPVAHYLRSGDDPQDMAALMVDLRAVQADMRRRYRTVRGLPRDVCPESKTTDALASDRRLGLHPVVVALDEPQVLFEHSTYGAEASQLVTDMVKRGRAVGVMIWLATQRPDAKSIPTGVSANATLRLCMKVMGQVENDMVLGTSSYKNGVRATMFGRYDFGVAILAGEGADPVVVRGAYVDGPTAETIAARARAARAAAGLLSGMAAGDIPPDTDTGSVLDHLLACWPEDEARAWCDDLAGRLAAKMPDLYTGWTGEQVTLAVKPHGVASRQVKKTVDGEPVNRRGLSRKDVVAAWSRTPPPDEPAPDTDDVGAADTDEQEVLS